MQTIDRSETASKRVGAADRLPAFIAAFDALLDGCRSEPEIVAQGKRLLAELVAVDDWLPAELAVPSIERFQQYPLHVDPAGRFSVVSFVWGPGQSTPIHDHTVWGLIGMLRGAEYSQEYRFTSSTELLATGLPQRLEPGQVEAVSPRLGDVHRVSNAFDDRVSISVHVYGADIGAVRRSVYAEDGSRRDFVSGYSPVPSTFQQPIPSAILAMTATITYADVRSALIDRREIALLDVREEDPFAQEHPLWAANLPLSRLELDAWGRIPRRDAVIAVYGDELDASQAERAVAKLEQLGYTRVSLLEGGLAGWREVGGELFRDVNVPSKSFGELVESKRHTPSLSAEEVQALLDEKADVVVLDARRFDEYQTMNIPGSTSVPGGELVLRARELAPNPATTVIVNCAGRTRSIIGTQSLVNAGLPNPVAALRNGTIGWTLAGQVLAHGSSQRFENRVDPARLEAARASAADVAKRAGVSFVKSGVLDQWVADRTRTTYRFDVRTPEEYAVGHAAGFRSAPGGQLVQETDVHCPVRGARIVLTDDDGVRASMTASWLAQMGWHVAVLSRDEAARLPVETGADVVPRPAAPVVPKVDVSTVAGWLTAGEVTLIDVTTSANYVKRHIPGAVWALRAQLAEVIATVPTDRRVVLTCASSLLAFFAATDALGRDVLVLDGGNAAWVVAGLPVESGETHLASPRIDRYRRPYEGTDNAAAAMQAYLDWEFGLVEQLGRDGTHHFEVI